MTLVFKCLGFASKGVSSIHNLMNPICIPEMTLDIVKVPY